MPRDCAKPPENTLVEEKGQEYTRILLSFSVGTLDRRPLKNVSYRPATNRVVQMIDVMIGVIAALGGYLTLEGSASELGFKPTIDRVRIVIYRY